MGESYYTFLRMWGVDSQGFFDEIRCFPSKENIEDDVNYICKGESEGLDMYTGTLADVVEYYRNRVDVEKRSIDHFECEFPEEKTYVESTLFEER